MHKVPLLYNQTSLWTNNGIRCGNLRAALPQLRRLFEGVGKLQHAEIILVPADDLHPDRQPFRG